MKQRIALLLCCLLPGAALADDSIGTTSLRFGGEVEVTQTVDGSLHAAAGRITVDAPVDGNARLAGGTVQLASGAAIGGNASIAGGTIVMDGAVKDDFHAAGGRVTINGAIGGNASIAAGTLELGPRARIDGRLNFRGGELQRDPAAQVKGGIDERVRGHTHRHERGAFDRFGRGWVGTVGLIVLAALLAAAFPGPARRMSQELRDRPWVTALLGLVALTAIPVAAVLFMVTVIGIPIGLLALLGYAALLMLGYVGIAVVVGGLLLDRINPQTAARTAARVGAAVVAMLALALLARLPFVGHFIAFVALTVGVGMIVGAIWRRTPAHPA